MRPGDYVDLCPCAHLGLLSLSNLKTGPPEMDTVNEEHLSWHLTENPCSSGVPRQPSPRSLQHTLETTCSSRTAPGRTSHEFPLAQFLTLGVMMKKTRRNLRRESSQLCYNWLRSSLEKAGQGQLMKRGEEHPKRSAKTRLMDGWSLLNHR